MTRDPLIRAWAWLVALSIASTALATALTDLPGSWRAGTGVVILLLSWLKARQILNTYLGLSQAPFWKRGFGMVLLIFMTGMVLLYIAGAA